MKKKCMAVGGTAKKPATMEEQLAGIRGKVRPGYQAGGIAGQVDDLMNRTKAMPNSIASAPQPYGGSVIPAQTGQQAMQSATNFGMPPAGTAPASSSQTISTGDYSTGPKETGFIFSDGTRRDGLTQEQAKQLESQQAMQRAQQSANAPTPQAAAPLMTMAEKESSLGLNPNRTYTPGSAMDPLASGGGISQALKVANPSPSLPNVAVAQIPQIEPVGRNRQRNRGFADGGILDKLIRTVGKILPESNGQKYEPGIQSRAAEDPARHGRAEALNPRTQTASPESPPAGGFQEEAERRRKQMKEAMNYEAGGMVRFSGKGGPRDDQIPVKVAGQEINVSNGENAVILPAKTAANPAALYAIGGIIQATNDGRKPKMGMEKGGNYKDGGVYPYDGKRPPTSQEVYAGVSPAGMVQAITPDSWRTARVVAPAGSVGGGMSSSGTDPRDIPAGGTITNLAPALQQIHNFAKPAYDLSPSMRALGSVGSAVGNVFADSAEANRKGTTYGDARAARIAAEGKENAAPYSNEGRPSALGQAYQSYKPKAQGIAAGVANDYGAVVNDGMTTTQMGAGFDPTKLQMAPGYGMASNAAGKTISVGPSEYIGADGKPTSRWTDTQQYKDAIARNEADKLRLAEMQARRLGADPMAVQKASQGIAQSVMQSGLAAQQAGQAQQIQQFAIDRAAREQSLIDAWDKAETPEQKQAIAGQLKIMRGQQDKEGQFKDAVEEVVDEKTGQVIKRPVIYNASTGQPVQQGQAQAQQSFKTADEVEAARKAGKVKSGDVVIINGRPARIN